MSGVPQGTVEGSCRVTCRSSAARSRRCGQLAQQAASRAGSQGGGARAAANSLNSHTHQRALTETARGALQRQLTCLRPTHLRADVLQQTRARRAPSLACTPRGVSILEVRAAKGALARGTIWPSQCWQSSLLPSSTRLPGCRSLPIRQPAAARARRNASPAGVASGAGAGLARGRSRSSRCAESWPQRVCRACRSEGQPCSAAL